VVHVTLTVLSLPRCKGGPPFRLAQHNSDGYERIARFHVEQYAYLATKLDTMKEGNGTVLDNTCLMFLSNMWIGREHDNFRLPVCWPAGLAGLYKRGVR
jgi:hypothetical protein